MQKIAGEERGEVKKKKILENFPWFKQMPDDSEKGPFFDGLKKNKNKILCGKSLSVGSGKAWPGWDGHNKEGKVDVGIFWGDSGGFFRGIRIFLRGIRILGEIQRFFGEIQGFFLGESGFFGGIQVFWGQQAWVGFASHLQNLPCCIWACQGFHQECDRCLQREGNAAFFKFFFLSRNERFINSFVLGGKDGEGCSRRGRGGSLSLLFGVEFEDLPISALPEKIINQPNSPTATSPSATGTQKGFKSHPVGTTEISWHLCGGSRDVRNFLVRVGKPWNGISRISWMPGSVLDVIWSSLGEWKLFPVHGWSGTGWVLR